VKIYIYFVGKPKDANANALAAEYIRRADRYASSTMVEIREDRTDIWAKHPSARKIVLDPAGKPLDSNAFACMFARAEMHGHDLVFAIGGHEGVPEKWRVQADVLLSISAMTMPHELARAVLAEQIYRAFTILRGHPYPR
jgi:23S rRNA (pseudouridine1915-N3)-methyltransferase